MRSRHNVTACVYDKNAVSILDDIVDDTRRLLTRRKKRVAVSDLEERPLFERDPLPLAPALRREELAVIAEVKKASPSKGVIRPDFDPVDIARQYVENGAAALSVLTEPQHFQGELDYLAQVRSVADVPILRKDFIVDPYQLVEARAYGADAVLLIAAVLDAQQLYDLHQAAGELGLSCLVELYDREELDKVDLDQAKVLGVNNRDLRTFDVDLDHALRIFEEVPPSLVRVGESGLRTAQDLVHLRRHGVDAVLIGETLMRARRPGEKLRSLRENTTRLLTTSSY